MIKSLAHLLRHTIFQNNLETLRGGSEGGKGIFESKGGGKSTSEKFKGGKTPLDHKKFALKGQLQGRQERGERGERGN